MKRYNVHLKLTQFIVDHSSFRASLICCILSDRPGVIVLTFQVLSFSAWTACFYFVLFGAMITIRLSCVVLKLHAPNEADQLWRDSTYLAGASQLEAAVTDQ